MSEIITKYLYKLTSRGSSPKPISLITDPPSDPESNSSQSPTPPISISSDADVASETTSPSDLASLPAQLEPKKLQNGVKPRRTRPSRAAQRVASDDDVATPVQTPKLKTPSTRNTTRSTGSQSIRKPKEPPVEEPAATRSGKQTEEKRVLRSQDTKPTSELLTYFPWLDDEYNEARKQAEYVGYDTPFYIVDDDIKSVPSSPVKTKLRSSLASSEVVDKGTSTEIDNIVAPSTNAEDPPPPQPKKYDAPIKFSYDSYREKAKLLAIDPLSDARYQKSHRRAEVAEKRLRNIERERVQHDRAKFQQYLERLNGPEWLKLLGFDRVRPTEEERKHLEGKREALITEIELILKKFKDWKEEEKRLKAGRDGAIREHAASPNLACRAHTVETTASHEDQYEEETSAASFNRSRKRKASIKTPSVHTKPKTANSSMPTEKLQLQQKEMTPSPPKPNPKPMTSFYDNDVLRAAALRPSSRITRNTTAFGHPLPEIEERDFDLSDEFRDNVPKSEIRHRDKRLRVK